MLQCRCPKHNHLLGEAEVGSVVGLFCFKCKKSYKFTIVKEPDCHRATAFIESQNNEKTVNHFGNSVA